MPQQSLCAPSRNSMLTSRRPDTLRLYDFYSYWRDQPGVGNFSTLPQHLKAAGYTTRSFGKIFHPGASSNHTDDQPYSWSAAAYHSPAESFMNRPVCPDETAGSARLERNVICPVTVRYQPLQTLPDLDAASAAKQFLRQHTVQSPATPFFVAVGLHKPHIPLRFPSHYLDRHASLRAFAEPPFAYVPHGLPAVAFNPYTDIRSRSDAGRQNITFPFGPVPPEFGQRLRQAYYAAVSYVDDVIGDLLLAVDAASTVVMLTSDHGWSLGEHAEWAKYSNYEVAVRVPLIVRAPHLRRASAGDAAPPVRVERIVELLDVFPTLVELAGAGVPQLVRCAHAGQPNCTEGKSLVPMMVQQLQPASADADTAHAADVAYSQYPRPAAYPQANSDRPRLAHIRQMGYTMRTPMYRYTAWVAFDPSTFRRDWTRVAAEELYDHRLDTGEDCNLADRPELHGVRRMLRRRLRRKFP